MTEVEGRKGGWCGNLFNNGGYELNLFNLLGLFHIVGGSAHNPDSSNLAEHILVVLHIRQLIVRLFLLLFVNSGQLPVVIELRNGLLNDSSYTSRQVEGCIVVISVLEPAGKNTFALLVVKEHRGDGTGFIAGIRFVHAVEELVHRLAGLVSGILASGESRCDLREGPHLGQGMPGTVRRAGRDRGLRNMV